MNVIPTRLPGVLILEPRVFRDDRGFFMETWHLQRFSQAGLPPFVQDNFSSSRHGVLRGLHFQNPTPQGKLLQVLFGEVFDVAVDVRLGSPTFGVWEGVTLSADNRRQFFVPEGYAHGFVVTSETANVVYKCTDFYQPSHEACVRWDDPDLAIDWPVQRPTLAPKDATAPVLKDVPPDRLPKYKPLL